MRIVHREDLTRSLAVFSKEKLRRKNLDSFPGPRRVDKVADVHEHSIYALYQWINI